MGWRTKAPAASFIQDSADNVKPAFFRRLVVMIPSIIFLSMFRSYRITSFLSYSVRGREAVRRPFPAAARAAVLV